jgi:hypothetical protein
VRQLAGRIVVPHAQFVYPLPYHTRGGGDTEYLISNPGVGVIAAALWVFGKNCKLIKRLTFKLSPHCTRSIRLRPIVPEHAGHCILVANTPPVIHLVYYRANDVALVAAAQAGRDNLLAWRPGEPSRTYGFGYRALPLGHDSLGGSVFVSNPNGAVLSGAIAFFDQACKQLVRKLLRIPSGCTAEFRFPPGRFGYGTVTVALPAAINVLHFAASSHGVASAELIGEADRVPVAPPRPRSRILFDDTHGCRPGVVGDWTQYEAALVAAGYTVTHFTQAPVTLAALHRHDVFIVAMVRSAYTAPEKQAINDFVAGGGGLLVVQDFGNAPWSAPTREILNLVGANDDNNFMQDPTNCFTPGQTDDVVFDYQRNFHSHPIVNGLKYFHVDAAASLSGSSEWVTIAETDDDSTPARRPALIARSLGAGRVVAFGDSNTWADQLIGNLENKRFGVRCAEWLLYRI